MKYSTESFGFLVDSSPNAIFQCDFKGKLCYHNKKGKRFLEFFFNEKGALIGKIKEIILQDKLEQERVEIELEKHHFFLNFAKDKAKKLINIYVTEIGLLKQKERELIDQKNFFQEVFDNIPADLVVLSPEHKYLFINPIAIKNEKVRKWLIGKDDFDYVKERNLPTEIAEERRAFFNRIIQGKKIIQWEEEKQINGKTEIILRRMLPVYDKNDTLKYVIGYALDISEIKQTEQDLSVALNRLDLVIKASNDAFWDWNISEDSHYFSPRLFELLEANTTDAIKLDSFLWSKEKSSFHKLINGLKAGAIKDFEETFCFFKSNSKKKLYLKLKAIALKGTNGDISRIVGSFSDVTKDINYQEILKKAKRRAEEGSKIKSNFLSTMSHEIRTPLNAVIGLANILQMQEHLPAQVEHLNSLKLSANNLLSLINDILDWNKIESGNIVFEKVNISLSQILKNISATYNHQAREKAIELKCIIDKKIETKLLGDATRLTQIFNNLIGNAIKFTEKGEVKVNLTLMAENERFQKINFAIADTGIGIPKEKQKDILKAFSQASSDTTRKFGGTGLGLSITNKLIELLGGKLTIESELEKGSVFQFNLEFEKPQFTQQNLGEADQKKKLIDLKNLKVLLVEDNLLNIVVAQTLIENMGPKVTVAENGFEAVELVKNNSFDLVFMDLHMPEMDGYVATKKIRTFNKELPIIALTASAFTDAKNKVLKSGMNDFLTKPFDPEKLKLVMSNALKNRKTNS